MGLQTVFKVKGLARTAAAALTLALAAAMPAAAKDPEVLTMGVIPFEEIQLTAEKFKGVVKAIEAATGKKVEWFFPTSYASLIESQRRGFIHIGYYGPESYIKATEVSNGAIEAFAQAMWGGGSYRTKEDGYRSFIIVKADSPFQSVADLKGKTLALTNASSTSGNLIPKVELGKQLNTKLGRHFGQVFYAGSHTAAALAVLQGRADAAAVADVTLDWAVDKKEFDGKTFRIIWRSSKLPLDPFAWRKDLLSEDLRKKIAAALIELDKTPEGRDFLKRTRSERVEPVADSAYDGVRAVMKEYKAWE
ncbi:MAG TPA: phosphate/phosphite/phosphonate ABC transporter substrate-binding protein [Burkholderiaceae bacterium]|jgi:phosphonate transport system substrate-binding protein|nr:phosphate/phosphite/phosphonate ABC transporter substrate-binding protein [Burkholderiaceae bacterium]